jgi:hypothetical protein
LTVASVFPIGWILKAPTPTWREAIGSRHWFRLFQWTWYEWLGVIGPMVIFLVLARLARRRGDAGQARFFTAVLYYALFQQTVAMIMLGPDALITLTTLEPMRYLHLVYVFMAVVAGGLIGQHLLRNKVWRWGVFLVVINIGMFAAQRELFADSPHLELPGMRSGNPWLEAFEWVRQNTPEDAYFALDPKYMAAQGEDYHSFRALAERSMLSDGIKDTSVVTKVPELGPLWHEQQMAMAGWEHFQLADFERLKARYGVNWAIVTYPPPAAMPCPWHNGSLSVCRIP